MRELAGHRNTPVAATGRDAVRLRRHLVDVLQKATLVADASPAILGSGMLPEAAIACHRGLVCTGTHFGLLNRLGGTNVRATRSP